jgi:hypothetical protein
MTQAKSMRSLLITLAIGGCATTAPPTSPSMAGAGPVAHVQATVLEGSPTIRLTLDREYRVIEMRAESPAEASRSELRTWMLVPKDEQSSVTFGIGVGGNRKTEEVIARMYDGAVVTKVPGAVAGKQVEWWHYQDSQHLYSTCYADLPDKAGVEHPVYIELVANRPQRIASLEEAFSRIEVD